MYHQYHTRRSLGISRALSSLQQLNHPCIFFPCNCVFTISTQHPTRFQHSKGSLYKSDNWLGVRIRHCQVTSRWCTTIHVSSPVSACSGLDRPVRDLPVYPHICRTLIPTHIPSAVFTYSMHPVATSSLSPYAMRPTARPPAVITRVYFILLLLYRFFSHFFTMFIPHSSFTTLHLFTAHCHRPCHNLFPVRLVNVAISLHPVDSSLPIIRYLEHDGSRPHPLITLSALHTLCELQHIHCASMVGQ